jgi:uncharacterized protein
MLLASVAAAILAAIVLTAAWSAVATRANGDAALSERRLGLARFARSMLLPCFAAAYAFALRRSRPPFLLAAGLVPARRAAASYATGFIAGAVPVLALIAVLLVLGARTVDVRGSAVKIASMALKYAALGIPFVLLEEGVFRGLLLGDLERAIGARPAVVAGSLFYAVTHFLGAPKSWIGVAEQPTAVEAVFANFAGLERMFREWPEVVGLFLAGVILSILRLRSGALWLGMGLHAGWYWVKSMDRYFVRDVDAVVEANRVLLGSSQYHDGVVGWAVLLGTLALTIRLTGSRFPGPGRSEP